MNWGGGVYELASLPYDAVAMSQEECCKIVRSSVTIKEVKTNVRWRDELRHQPGPGGPITQQEKMGPAS